MASHNGFSRSFSGRKNPAAIGFLAAVLVVSLTLAAPLLAADQKSKAAEKNKTVEPAYKLSKAFKGKLPITDLSQEQAVIHALNRLAFGPRPGDVERIRAMGLEKWIQQQLKPESIDDSAVAKRLEQYTTLAMSTSQLMDEYPNPNIEAAKRGMAPEEYRKQLQEQQREQVRQTIMQNPELAAEARRARQGGVDNPNAQALRMELMNDKTPRRVVGELSAAKLTRAIYSERQLQEVMADFWFNHFNVFAQKGPVNFMLPSYERDIIRRHAMGKFGDLLSATAKSPAMLFYLDNWQSADPVAFAKLEDQLVQRRRQFLSRFGGMDPRMAAEMQRRGRLGQRGGAGTMPDPNFPGRRVGVPGQGQIGQQPQQLQRRGLNENYARELMELHTLGVDGGYTQQDVIEVARAFTGWTLRAPRRDPEFNFEERIHADGPFSVLGHKIDGGGMKAGEQVLELLVAEPNTAKFISTKLARRFVSDTPPAALVDRMAKEFQETHGNIPAVLEAMIYSPEFWSREAYRAKIKKPFELVASAARALGADVSAPIAMVLWAARIGEPLYLCQPPTGYSDKAETWVNTGALLNRLNYAMERFDEVRGRRHHRRSCPWLSGIPAPVAFLEVSMNITRRYFLKSSGVAMVGLSAMPAFLTRAVLATPHPAGTSRKILVVLFQRGAMDGLNAVIPYAEPDYYRLRPTIAVPQPRRTSTSLSASGSELTAVDLDGFFGLHPSLAPLESLFKQRQLAIVHAAGSPDTTRSHFDAQDYMESGTPGRKSTEDGWLNRALQMEKVEAATPFRAVAMGTNLPRALQGTAPAVALPDMRQFQMMAASPVVEGGFEAVYAQTVDKALRGTGTETFEAIDMLRKANPQRYQPENGAQYPQGRFGQSLLQVAQLIKANIGLEVAFLDSGGWDHHVNEG
ncbi:MAG: DUF1800 family protein, partial [Acidobacteria bacterium]|nr:DUF1800 family protein [Acidobacteriota bacterium]